MAALLCPMSLESTIDTLDDATLLARIAAAPSAAQAEIEVFYARHVRYLFAVMHKQTARIGFASHETEDLVQDTFQRAFEYARTFRPSEQDDPDAARRWTRAWLGKIARNLVLDALKAPREALLGPQLEAHGVDPFAPPSSRPANPRLVALQSALEQLSEREQDVLRVSALYYRAGEHQRLPGEVLQELALRWQTTGENIRAIRSRALKKVQNMTEAVLQTQAPSR
jgi:RNA polymerase sigma factor (sigma-70 family)